MKVYLAGAISGTDDYHDRFAKYAQQLRWQGHSVYNPAAANQEGRSQRQIMSHLLPILCEQEVIAMIPNWEQSRGSCIEILLARYIGLAVMFL